MEILVASLLLIIAIYLVAYQFLKPQIALEEAHLPSHEFNEELELPLPQILEEEASLYRRSWSPLTSKFKALAKRIPVGKMQRRLIKAGSPMGILEFIFIKVLLCTLLPTIAMAALSKVFQNKTALYLGALAIGFILPDIWLQSKIKRRQLNIRRDLPNIIDLLSLCVSGGLDFMLAVSRVVRDMRRCDLTMELEEVYHQTQMGKSRKEALKNLAWRIDMPETYSFVRTLVQADRMGSPVSEALKMQSEEIRTRRFQRGEAMALKAPIKLLFPLFAFILPVVMIIVGGPIILQFTRGGMNLGF